MISYWLFLKACVGTVLSLVAVRILSFVLAVWNARSLTRRLRKLGMPMPPHNPILGHMLDGKLATDELPPKAHSTYILNRMSMKYGQQGVYYLDMFPVMQPLVVVSDPRIAHQATNHPTVTAEKPESLLDWFHPITGGPSLFTQNDEEWKRDHALFVPFFSNSNLDASIPVVSNQMKVYREKLRKMTTGVMFFLEPLTLALMNDIIGTLVFNADLGAQTRPHPLTDTMLRQLSLKFSANSPLDHLGRLNPFKLYSLWNNSRMLNNHIKVQIGKRVDIYRSSKAQDDQDMFNSLLDTALESYFAQPGRRTTDEVDPNFLKMLYAQMRMFFFAGYDSTAATMVYCCYMVWNNPDALSKMRAEHDKVFGPNIAAAMDIIAEKPVILNSLPYTYAVIKETMRLFPAANAIRVGSRDLVLKNENGDEFPTEGCAIQINHLACHYNPEVWVRPLEFLPERFLVQPGHELYPVKGAWRPFEYGVRMCTGQALVIKELKAFLVLMAREFDIKECYDEFDGGHKMDLTNVYSQKVYQVEAGSAHPRDRFPCRISLSGYEAASGT